MVFKPPNRPILPVLDPLNDRNLRDNFRVLFDKIKLIISKTLAPMLVELRRLETAKQDAFVATDSVTAATGSSQGDGPVTGNFIHVSTCANAGDAITLPAVTASAYLRVANDGAESMDIFPPSGEEINGAGANTAVALASGARAYLVYQDTGKWRMVTM